MASTISETLVGYASFSMAAGPTLTVKAASNLDLIAGGTLDLVSVRIGPPVLTAPPNTPAVAAFNANTPSVSDPWRLATVTGGVENPYYKIIVTMSENAADTSARTCGVVRQDDCTWLLGFFSGTVAAGVLTVATTAYSATVSIYTVSLSA